MSVLTYAQYMERIGFPAEAIRTVDAAITSLGENPAAVPLLYTAEKQLFDKAEPDKTFLETLVRAKETTDLPQETLDMAFLVSCLPRLRDGYLCRGIPEEIFWDSMHDLTCKLRECYDNRGVYGTFVTFWYPGFYRMTRFALGRLQYEYGTFPYDDRDGIRKNARIVQCHIPSSGPLTDELVTDSLARAKAFFPDDLIGGRLPVYCSSWLIYPPLVGIFPEGSNLRRFAERFTVVDAIPRPENGDFWRIFNFPYDPEKLADAPEDTSLRRAVKAFLLAGNCLGAGKGIIWSD